MLRNLHDNRSMIAAGFLAVCLFLVSPVTLIGHHHSQELQSGHCVVCTVASTAAAIQPLESAMPLSSCTGTVVLTNITPLSRNSTGQDNPRAPPPA